MTLETLEKRIKEEALSCANCGNNQFALTQMKDEIYACICKRCGHKRIEIDYPEVK